MSKLRSRIEAIERLRRPGECTRSQLEQDVAALLDKLRMWEREVNDFLPIGSAIRRSWRQPTPDTFERLTADEQELFRQLLEVDATY